MEVKNKVIVFFLALFVGSAIMWFAGPAIIKSDCVTQGMRNGYTASAIVEICK